MIEIGFKYKIKCCKQKIYMCKCFSTHIKVKYTGMQGGLPTPECETLTPRIAEMQSTDSSSTSSDTLNGISSNVTSKTLRVVSLLWLQIY